MRSGDDQFCSSEGTFRTFNPLFETAPSGEVSSVPARSWLAISISYLRGLVTDPLTRIEEGDIEVNQRAEQFLGMAGCQKEVKVTLKLALKSDADAHIIGVSASGEAEIEWSKSKDEVRQLASFPRRDDFNLIIVGVANCNGGSKPAYLNEAQFNVGTTYDENRSFLVERPELFQKLNEETVLKQLEANSSLANGRLALSQMLVIPLLNGKKTSFYYTLFDQFERYMSAKVFGAKSIDLSKEDKFALTMLVFQLLSYWETQN